MVPVLSEHKIFMLPKFSIDESLFTITCCFAIVLAPVERLTVMIAGNNCGVNPTANASENKKESSAGLCNKILIRENYK